MGNTLRRWEIDIYKIVAIITDSEANISAEKNSLVGRNQHIACFAHLVNLIVEKPLTELIKISDIITRVRNIVKWITNSVNASDSLRNKQRQNNVKERNLKKLILDVDTVEQLLLYVGEIHRIVSNSHRKIWFGKRDADMLNGDELSIIKELMIVLKTLEFMTKELSGEARRENDKLCNA